jgi:hypothetical protein
MNTTRAMGGAPDMLTTHSTNVAKLMLIALLTAAALVASGPTVARAQKAPITGPEAATPTLAPFATVGACLRLNGFLADPTATTNVRVHDAWGTWILGVKASGEYGDAWFNLARAAVVQPVPSTACPE